jgi:hypothetical protein
MRPAALLRIWRSKWLSKLYPGWETYATTNTSQGEEVLYLPAIVEACESSPGAAKEAAYMIRKFLSKDNFARPHVQYNAIMLIRILSDNPGKTFTRNMDSKFVQTVKELLRLGRDPSVKQILMETLDTFQREKASDEGCAMLNEMWKKEHEKMLKIHVSPPFSSISLELTIPRARSDRGHRNRRQSMAIVKTTLQETTTQSAFHHPMSSHLESKKLAHPLNYSRRPYRAHRLLSC